MKYRTTSRTTVSSSSVALAWVILGACSSPQDNDAPDEDGDDAAAQTGGQGTDGPSGGASHPGAGGTQSQNVGGTSSPNSGGAASGGDANTATGGHGGELVEFEYDPNLDVPRETCAALTLTAQPLPLDMYVILDRTGSMRTGADSLATSDCEITLGAAPTSTSKWCKGINALGNYFTSQSAAGHRAALQFMQPDNGPSVCSGAGNLHSTPAVDFTLLPETGAQAGGLIDTMNDAVADASNSTDIESALHGIVDFTSASRSPARRMIGILVTDGAASGDCQLSDTLLAEIPRDHFNATGIPTFIIGMTGAPYEPLATLSAESGGPAHDQFCDPTDPNPTCHYWSVGDGDPEAFVAALDAIQESAIGCEFSVPSPTQGIIDLDTVVVQFTPDSTSAPLQLTQAAEVASCAGDQYYRVSLGDTEVIKLCPSTCAQLGDASTIEVEVQCDGS